MVFLFVLITFDLIGQFWGFWTNPEIQDGRHSEMSTQLLRHLTSSYHDADIFRRTIHPSLVVIVFIFSELRRGEPPPPTPVVEDQKKPGLNRVKFGSGLRILEARWSIG